MAVLRLDASRVFGAKRAFSTRRVLPERMRTLITGKLQPEAGDLVLARVNQIGKQTKLELTDGRRAHMFPGDEIIVSFGNRYAPDQYEAVIGPDLSPCDLVAAGGIAGIEISRHQRMLPPTSITPVGLIGGEDGTRLNLRQFAVEAGNHLPEIPAILSLGTSMNAGKTLTATSLVRGLKRLGFSVAALKVTGTGAGGDMWIVRDAGADIALDFTDAGFGTTYLTPVPEIESATYRLMNHAAAQGCEIAVIEVADGLQQLETAQLIRSEAIRRISLGVVFAAYDAMGAKYGVDVLREAGHAVLAMSGRLGRSPLGVREAEAATGLRVYSPYELQEGALIPAIRERAAELHAESGFREAGLGRVAEGAPAVGRLLLEAGGPATGRGEGDGAGRGAAANGQVISFHPRPVHERTIELLGLVAETVMRTEVARLCAASSGRGLERRRDRRNGFRDGIWATAFGTVPLRIPKLRLGYYRPSFLDHVRNTSSLVGEVEAVMAADDDKSLVVALAALSGGMGAVLAPRDMSVLIARIRKLRALWQARDAGAPAAARDPEDIPGPWIPGAGRDDEEAEGAGRSFALAPPLAQADQREPDEDEEGFAVSPGAMFQAPRVVAGE